MSSAVTSSRLPAAFSATNALIALNIALALACASRNPHNLLLPDRQTLIDMGANFGLLTGGGEYGRLISSMFLHAGIIHLGINMYGLRCVGSQAESLFGWRNFLIIYFFAGIMGGLSTLTNDPLNVSVGASGAIFGVWGSLLAFLYVQRSRYSPETLRYHAMLAAGLFVCNLLWGLMVPGLDNFAHLGGVLAGAFSGLLLARLEVKERWRAAYAVPVMLLMVAMLGWISHTSYERRGLSDYRAGLLALKQSNYEQAVQRISAFIQKNGQEADAFGSRGVAYWKLGDLRHAAQDFNKVVALAPESAEPYNSRAWVENGLGQYVKAVDDATISLQLNPRSPATYDTRGYAFAKLGETNKALEDFAKGLKLDNADAACHYHRMRLYESLGCKQEADADRVLAAGYKPEPWER